MRAVVLERYGGPEALTVADVAEPEPAPEQVVVRMAGSGLNRLDVFVRQGLIGRGVRQPRALPHVMGAEGAGTVVDVGRAARTDLAPGDDVIVSPASPAGTARGAVAARPAAAPGTRSVARTSGVSSATWSRCRRRAC